MRPGSMREWLERTRNDDQPAAPEPEPVRVRPTPEADAVHLVALLAEGAQPMLLNGRLYLTGNVTAKAEALFAEHGSAITRLVEALVAGRVDRQALAAGMAEVDGWRWPGDDAAPAVWPGTKAFLLGVEPIRCEDCRRHSVGECAKYGRMPAQARPVRCLWALPKKEKLQ